MNIETLKSGATRVFGRGGLLVKKHSPELLVIGGLVSIIGGTVVACKSTLKVEDVVENAKNKIDQINDVFARPEDFSVEYDSDDRTKDLVIVYTQTAVEFIKLYGPALVLGATGVAAILGAHNIMRKRNVALIASYTGLDKAFRSYQKRVVESIGADKEFNIRHNVTKEKITTTEENPETGKTKKVSNEVSVINGNEYSIYSRFFDEFNINHSVHPEHNLVFLRAQQTYANDMLHARGHVFLNDVYDALGMERTSAGAVVGWILGDGDNFIDFGMYDSVRFINGREASVLLDFNVDGVIYDLIG